MNGRCHKCGCMIVDGRCVGCRAKMYVDDQLALACQKITEEQYRKVIEQVIKATSNTD